MSGLSPDLLRLVEAARKAREHAHAPYSRFQVGAAVRARSGRCYVGANVEISSYGLTLCAERVAIAGAVFAGDKEIEALAVVTDSNRVTGPCGACRQFLADFGPHATVVLAPLTLAPVVTNTEALLPLAFGPDDLLEGPR
jgi:cytidine deaminase